MKVLYLQGHQLIKELAIELDFWPGLKESLLR